MAAPKKKLKMNQGKVKKLKLNHSIKNKYISDLNCTQRGVCFKSCKKNCIK